VAEKIDKQFEIEIQEAYFMPGSPVRLIDERLLDCFADLRASGCKIALNTGYPKPIQMKLIEALKLGPHIDCAVSSGEVGLGRPYPYMIHKAMKALGIVDVKQVAKAGDTARDMEEGLNAGSGLVLGVLTGAGSREGLEAAGADAVLDSIVDFGKMRGC